MAAAIDVVCIGELLIDFVPTEAAENLGAVTAFRRAAGGAPANVAVGLARLGRSAAFMGMVGDDPFGRFLGETLADNGVDVSALGFTDRARTALAFVSLSEDGERDFMFYRHPSADMLFAPADVDHGLLGRCRVVHFGSIGLIAEPSRSATLEAVSAGRAAGTRISYDPNLRLPLWPDAGAAASGLRLGLSHADLVKISEDEVAFLTGEAEPLRGARVLWTDATWAMVVTLGAAGCLIVTERAHRHVPGFATTVVDTTGAGDAFMAGFLAGVLTADDPEPDIDHLVQIARTACAVGALTVADRGAIPSLPTRAQVEAFLADRNA